MADGQKMKAEIIKKMQDADITDKECEDLLKFLGFSQKDSKRMVARFKPFTSDAFVEWLFASSVDDSGKVKAPSLGVIRLDYDYPPAPGDIDHSGSFMYDVYYRMVPGLTFEMCQKGVLTSEVEQNFIDAIRFLESKQVSGITGDCGFMMWFQKLARQYTTKPVFMSSLAHLPTIVAAMGDRELVAVFTANGKSLEPMRDLIKDECNIDIDQKKLVVVGCEDVPGFEAVAEGAKVDTLKVQPGIVEKARNVLRANPNIRAILMECTELPPYSDALRAALGLPVFDAITCADFFIRSRLDNPRVGLSEWQAKWDGKQEKYRFGQNIAADELDEIVNRDALGNSASVKVVAATGPEKEQMMSVPEYLKRDHASLGVIRLDYDFMPAQGDVDHPSTFAYPTYYRCVPGLTWYMCRDGKMPPEIEEEWTAAVKYLDDRGVSGITCDCSLSMWFQEHSREYSKRPVFMSPLVQLPAILSAFNREEKVLIVTEEEENLRKLMDLVKEECGIDPTEKRFHITGVMQVEGFERYLRESKDQADEVAERVAAHIKKKLDTEHGIRAILLEDTALSPFSDWVKAVTEVPVFDAVSCCDLFMNGSMDNQLFGMNGWQKEWDGKTERYKLGQHLTKLEREKLNHKVATVVVGG